MAQSIALLGLAKKREELAGEVDSFLVKVDAIRSDIKTLDAAIKIFDPDFDLRSLRPRKRRTKNAFFGHGESTRFVLDTLRESTEPRSTIELADMAATFKGLDIQKIDYNALKACVLTTLSRQRVTGRVVECGRAEDGTIKWELAN